MNGVAFSEESGTGTMGAGRRADLGPVATHRGQERAVRRRRGGRPGALGISPAIPLGGRRGGRAIPLGRTSWCSNRQRRR